MWFRGYVDRWAGHRCMFPLRPWPEKLDYWIRMGAGDSLDLDTS